MRGNFDSYCKKVFLHHFFQIYVVYHEVNDRNRLVSYSEKKEMIMLS